MVSEKLLYLSDVYKNLDEIGLGQYCRSLSTVNKYHSVESPATSPQVYYHRPRRRRVWSHRYLEYLQRICHYK